MGTTIIDSTYNATIDGVRAMLQLFKQYPVSSEHPHKWLVLGDMIEQGKSEVDEHLKLAEYILKVQPARVILVGPRLRKYTLPALEVSGYKDKTHSVLMPREALDYINANLAGGETMLFKGARFLEGIVEKLLANPNDAKKLCRREAAWVRRRKAWNI